MHVMALSLIQRGIHGPCFYIIERVRREGYRGEYRYARSEPARLKETVTATLVNAHRQSQRSSGSMVDTYFLIFSSAVPLQLVPSIWHALHDGMAWVAARMSEMTSAFIASVRVPGPVDASPMLVIVR